MKKLDFFTLEMSKNHLIRNFLRNGRLRINAPLIKIIVNPNAPVVQKVADEVVFRRFQGEGVEFFKSDLTDPPQIF